MNIITPPITTIPTTMTAVIHMTGLSWVLDGCTFSSYGADDMALVACGDGAILVVSSCCYVITDGDGKTFSDMLEMGTVSTS